MGPGSRINYRHEFRNAPPSPPFLSSRFAAHSRRILLKVVGIRRIVAAGPVVCVDAETWVGGEGRLKTSPNQRMTVITESNDQTFRRPLKPTYASSCATTTGRWAINCWLLRAKLAPFLSLSFHVPSASFQSFLLFEVTRVVQHLSLPSLVPLVPFRPITFETP